MFLASSLCEPLCTSIPASPLFMHHRTISQSSAAASSPIPALPALSPPNTSAASGTGGEATAGGPPRRIGTTFTLSITESILAGGVAGALAKTAIAPLDRQKIIFQVTSKQFSIGKAFRAMRETYHTEGVRALYRGNGAMMVRIIPYASIQYMAFEQYKKVHSSFPPSPCFEPFTSMLPSAHLTYALSHSFLYLFFLDRKQVALDLHHHELTPFLRFLCGGAAGATSVAATYPLDLMRARLGMASLFFKFAMRVD